MATENKSPHWVAWWALDNDDVKHQAENYEKTPIYLSYRGIAVIILLVLTLINFFFLDFNMFFFYLILVAVFGTFILLGNRFFIVLAMIWWTVEKGSTVFTSLTSQPVNVGGVFMSILFWALLMKFLYHAFAIENLRHKLKNKTNQGYEAQGKIVEANTIQESVIEKPRATVRAKSFCKKCGNKLDKDSEFCDSCGHKL